MAGCACGCGVEVQGKSVYASPACRQRASRARRDGGVTERAVTDVTVEEERAKFYESVMRGSGARPMAEMFGRKTPPRNATLGGVTKRDKCDGTGSVSADVAELREIAATIGEAGAILSTRMRQETELMQELQDDPPDVRVQEACRPLLEAVTEARVSFERAVAATPLCTVPAVLARLEDTAERATRLGLALEAAAERVLHDPLPDGCLPLGGSCTPAERAWLLDRAGDGEAPGDVALRRLRAELQRRRDLESQVSQLTARVRTLEAGRPAPEVVEGYHDPGPGAPDVLDPGHVDADRLAIEGPPPGTRSDPVDLLPPL